ncbi:hypothetical protein CC99x_005090 [Candidatus Berkiella cookevillensis]|uniref:Uncharacterized protein n=1 Tax=Candidatus Berkiella cookevillensis TaxID=437022 RepID=A0A0Q9YVL1_9GAMM|nr:hypothetical protein [Candidatus Berkiella cookevillensis]MCS5708275.1 hypothetical protein [Candidatus Berkiella cookevillensis]
MDKQDSNHLLTENGEPEDILLQDKQKILQLIDDELSIAEARIIIEKLKTNDVLRSYWRAQLLISSVLKEGSSVDWLASDITISKHQQQTEIIINKNPSSENYTEKKSGTS